MILYIIYTLMVCRAICTLSRSSQLARHSLRLLTRNQNSTKRVLRRKSHSNTISIRRHYIHLIKIILIKRIINQKGIRSRMLLVNIMTSIPAKMKIKGTTNQFKIKIKRILILLLKKLKWVLKNKKLI